MDIIANSQQGSGPENKPLTTQDFMEAMFIIKQHDDLQLAMQSVAGSIKRSPGNIKYLSMQEKIVHDIAVIQPLVVQAGVACAAHIEAKYGVKFKFITGQKAAEGGKPSLVLDGK